LTATLVKVSAAPLANTAMLEAGVALGVVGALWAVNTKSTNVTPFKLVPVTCSAGPAAVGAVVVGVLALYAHVAQSKPPKTVTPSSPAGTTRAIVNVPHAYTRLVAAAATPMA
jgi:hypothetical protein